MPSTTGIFVWFELMTSDLAAAQKFYCDVVGWTAADSGMEGPPYSLFSIDGAMVGGLMGTPDGVGAPPFWTGYISVDDVDASATQVVEHGGTVHRDPADIPGIGRFAVVAGPQGAVFNLFAPTGMGTGSLPSMSLGHVGWCELHCAEPVAALAFYHALFGWSEVNVMDMGPMGLYRMFATDGSPTGMPTGGVTTKPESSPAAFWLYYFVVESIGAAAERVRAAGGTVDHGPMPIPGDSFIVHCTDPQGAHFALVAGAE